MEIKDRQKMLVIAAGTCLALLLGDSFVYAPLSASWKERSERIADLRQKLDQGTSIVGHERVIRAHWDEMRTNALPSNVSLAETQMFKAFSDWERASGVTRVSIRPQWKQSEEDYMTLECRADYTGDMDKISRFLYELEKDHTGVKVENVELASRDDAGQQLTLGIEISGLMLTPPQSTQQP